MCQLSVAVKQRTPTSWFKTTTISSSPFLWDRHSGRAQVGGSDSGFLIWSQSDCGWSLNSRGVARQPFLFVLPQSELSHNTWFQGSWTTYTVGQGFKGECNSKRKSASPWITQPQHHFYHILLFENKNKNKNKTNMESTYYQRRDCRLLL